MIVIVLKLTRQINHYRYWIVLVLTAVWIAFVPLPRTKAAPTDRFYRIEASQYAFSPAVVTVNPGDQVTIELVSTDVVHGLYLDGYDLQMASDPGQNATLTFNADKQGTFRFRCAISCGPLHPFMIGKLRVGNNGLFWRSIGLAVLATAGIGLVKADRE